MNADSDEHFSNAEIESRNAMAIHVLYCNAKVRLLMPLNCISPWRMTDHFVRGDGAGD